MRRILPVFVLIAVGGLAMLVLMKNNFYSNKYKGPFIERYGKTFNSERRKIGLPSIEESWTLRISDSSHTQWSHKAIYNTRDVPEHIWKTLYFNDSTLIAEEDAFNYDQRDSIGDRLIVTSYFGTSDSMKFEFSRHYYKSYPPSEMHEVSFSFADSLLRHWGFKSYYTRVKNP